MQHATDNKAPGTFLDAESLRILHGSGGSNTWQRPAQQSINRVGHCPALKFHLQLEASRQSTLMLSTPPCNIFPLASPIMAYDGWVCERLSVCLAPLLDQTFICNDTSSAMIAKKIICATSTSTSTCTERQGTTNLERVLRRIWASASHFTSPKGNEEFCYSEQSRRKRIAFSIRACKCALNENVFVFVFVFLFLIRNGLTGPPIYENETVFVFVIALFS